MSAAGQRWPRHPFRRQGRPTATATINEGLVELVYDHGGTTRSPTPSWSLSVTVGRRRRLENMGSQGVHSPRVTAHSTLACLPTRRPRPRPRPRRRRRRRHHQCVDRDAAAQDTKCTIHVGEQKRQYWLIGALHLVSISSVGYRSPGSRNGRAQSSHILDGVLDCLPFSYVPVPPCASRALSQVPASRHPPLPYHAPSHH